MGVSFARIHALGRRADLRNVPVVDSSDVVVLDSEIKIVRKPVK